LQMIVKSLTGKRTLIQVKNRTTASYVAQKVEAQEGLPPSHQHLFFDTTVREGGRCHSIQHRPRASTISQQIFTGAIHHRRQNACGKLTRVLISRDTTVSELVRKIGAADGIPPCQQRIIFAGRQLQ
ncbi:hypothetical protein DOTSEDRAFT_95524, partial [Dothistroma septosporum NZE10]